MGDLLEIRYAGRLADGTVFDANTPMGLTPWSIVGEHSLEEVQATSKQLQQLLERCAHPESPNNTKRARTSQYVQFSPTQ